MTDNVHHIGNRRGTSGNGSRLASAQETVALLTACLALVRPAGMSDGEVEDWLGAAVSTIGPVPLSMLDRATLEARRTCNHHSQIVPIVVQAVDRLRGEQRQIDYWNAHPPIPTERRLAKPTAKLTQEMVDTMSPELRKIGLTCGALIEVDGRLVPAPDAA